MTIKIEASKRLQAAPESELAMLSKRIVTSIKGHDSQIKLTNEDDNSVTYMIVSEGYQALLTKNIIKRLASFPVDAFDIEIRAVSSNRLSITISKD